MGPAPRARAGAAPADRGHAARRANSRADPPKARSDRADSAARAPQDRSGVGPMSQTDDTRVERRAFTGSDSPPGGRSLLSAIKSMWRRGESIDARAALSGNPELRREKSIAL